MEIASSDSKQKWVEMIAEKDCKEGEIGIANGNCQYDKELFCSMKISRGFRDK